MKLIVTRDSDQRILKLIAEISHNYTVVVRWSGLSCSSYSSGSWSLGGGSTWFATRLRSGDGIMMLQKGTKRGGFSELLRICVPVHHWG